MPLLSTRSINDKKKDKAFISKSYSSGTKGSCYSSYQRRKYDPFGYQNDLLEAKNGAVNIIKKVKPEAPIECKGVASDELLNEINKRYRSNYDYMLLMTRNIFKIQGRDREGRVVLTFFACNVWVGIKYEVLWRVMKGVLDDIAGYEYVLLYFHHGYDRAVRPSFDWVAQSYNALSYESAKNMKKLVIVHPDMFIRSVINIFKSVLSEKLDKKIVFVDKLEDLNDHIEASRISIPADVTRLDESSPGPPPTSYFKEAATFSYKPTNAKILSDEFIWFGNSFSLMAKNRMLNDMYIPLIIVKLCSEMLENDGIKTPGIFRIPTKKELINQRIKSIKEDFNKPLNDPITTAVLIKRFFGSLNEPIFSFKAWSSSKKLANMTDEKKKIKIIKNDIKHLSKESNNTLKYLATFFDIVVSNESFNSMNYSNLGICLAPSLIWAGNNKETTIKHITAVIDYVTVYFINHKSIHNFIY